MAWFHCQFCNCLRELSDEHIGKPAKCPQCKKRGTVVGTRDGELSTIGRDIDGHDEPQSIAPSETASSGQFWNQFAEPNPSPTVASSTANAEPDEIDDWQNDESASAAPSAPNDTDSMPLRNRVQGFYQRAAEWSVKDSTGRVFETYITVRYLRWAWKVAIGVIGVSWLIGMWFFGVTGFEVIFKTTAEETAKQSVFAFFALGAFKIIVLAILLGLFTLICLLELFLVRMGLETVAVFFDIAHDIRRLADGRSSLEQTSDVA